jgi:hypothetical protein
MDAIIKMEDRLDVKISFNIGYGPEPELFNFAKSFRFHIYITLDSSFQSYFLTKDS